MAREVLERSPNGGYVLLDRAGASGHELTLATGLAIDLYG